MTLAWAILIVAVLLPVRRSAPSSLCTRRFAQVFGEESDGFSLEISAEPLQNISLANIEKLARGLRVKPGDLFKGIR